MTPRVRDDLPHAVRVVETEWIPLSDGTRLAARLWLPEGAGRVPVILEYLPYRLSDGTQAGDHQQMGWFAGHGYACARVDIRGTGNSGRDHRGRVLRAGATRRPRGHRVARGAGVVRRQGRHGGHVVERLQRPPARGAHAAGAARRDQHLRQRRPLLGRRALPRRPRDPDGHGPVGELHALLERAAARSRDRRRRLADRSGASASSARRTSSSAGSPISCATTTGGMARPASTTPRSAAR